MEKIIHGVTWPRITVNTRVSMTEDYVEMPDGVRLYTIVSVPLDGDGNPKKCPIVFMRSPYEHVHNGAVRDLRPFWQNQFTAHGYAYIHQHCRGTGDSEGVCVPYDERSDGLASLDYIRSLDCYNGEIYLYGGSYLSTVHLSILDPNPHDVKGAALEIQTDRMFFRNYRNGMNYAWCNLSWWLGMLKRQFPEQKTEGATVRPYKDIIKRIIGEDYPPYTETLMHDTYDEFWQNDPRINVIENNKIPLLLTEGWNDFYIEGMFSMWERMPADVRAKSAFVVGPWAHATRVNPKTVQYFPENGDIPSDYAAEWFDSIREGRAYKYAEVGKVNYYSMNSGLWKSREYNTDGAKVKRLYFGENAALTDEPSHGTIKYDYDPLAPKTMSTGIATHKPHEPNTLDGVFSFTCAPFEADEAYFGRIRWHMNVESDCEDTAFFIRVYFVEGGETWSLCETITSLSNIAPDYIPGTKAVIDLETPPIAFTIKKGGSIRVDVTSQSGIYVPHANVRGHWAEVTETKIAHNTLHLEDSYIELKCE